MPIPPACATRLLVLATLVGGCLGGGSAEPAASSQAGASDPAGAHEPPGTNPAGATPSGTPADGAAAGQPGSPASPETPHEDVLRVCPPNADGTCFVHVDAGTFVQGAQARDKSGPNHDTRAAADEGPPHKVTLPEFWILRTEATRDMVAECVEKGKCPESMRRVLKVSMNLPANGLDWQEASTVCGAFGGRLPTEAEWEYAARGTGWHRWPWGDLPVCPFDSDAELQRQSESRTVRVSRCGAGVEHAAPSMTPAEYNLTGLAVDFWTDAEFDQVCAAIAGLEPRAAADVILARAKEVLDQASKRDLLPTCTIGDVTYVAEGRKSVPSGLTGMAANVSEWVQDGYDKAFYASLPAAGATSPVAPVGADNRRVVRGGSFTAVDATEWRTTARASLPQDVQLDDVGFRCVREKAP